MIDLLSTVEYGGCSSKISASDLAEALKDIPTVTNENLLVSIDTGDDAGVYKLTDDLAIIQTTDFFPPICSDPYEFAQIAAANAVSDVYAMGGEVKTALNLVMFPKEKLPMEALKAIILGGMDKITEAGGIIVGGHTIDDFPPKYGLAVTGTVHPDKVITNANAVAGDQLILTKPLGTGIIVAGQRIDAVSQEDYQTALDYMKLLNKKGSELMQKYGVRAATDITGFGLLGHSYKIATESNVTISIDSNKLPLLSGALELAEIGCIPGACFRNQEYVETACSFATSLNYERRMLMMDAQTSGGLLICAPKATANDLLAELIDTDYSESRIIGEVLENTNKNTVINIE